MTELASVIQKGIEYVPAHFAQIATQRSLQQVQVGKEFQWRSHAGKLRSLFYIIPDPQILDDVTRPFLRTKELSSPFTYCLLHQWEDGEGNWDIFFITPERCLKHGGRAGDSREVKERGPELRTDLTKLFACGHAFPEPGKEGWPALLKQSKADVAERLSSLATAFGLNAAETAQGVVWKDERGAEQAYFVILPDPSDIDAVISLYEYLQATDCPIAYAFLATDNPEVFDIFSFTKRSYLQHHNQVKP